MKSVKHVYSFNALFLTQLSSTDVINSYLHSYTILLIPIFIDIKQAIPRVRFLSI